MTNLTLTNTALPAQRDQVAAKIAFVLPQTIMDRDFDITNRIKLIGLAATTAITLITGAVFFLL
ncbi:hypothetical protein ACOSOMT5_P3062 [Acidiphilium sp. MT5]